MKLQTILLTACVMAFGVAPAVNAEDNNGVRHYLSLGTSLAAGVQPDATGTNQVSDQGYPDQLFDIIEGNYRKLKHTKLGCPGETTDSMIDGGIFDGDIAIVKKQNTANNGDVVAALLEEEATLKTFKKTSSAVHLIAENPAYEPIVTKNVTILGKLSAVFRRY